MSDKIEKVNIDEIICLHITSWVGLAIGAEHYYGCLKPYDYNVNIEDVELKREITEISEARWLNKKNGCDIYQVGDVTNLFNTERQLIQVARKEYKKHFPKTKVILLGDSGRSCPQEIILGPRNLKKFNNSLWKAYEYAWKEGKKYNLPDEKILEIIEPIEEEWEKIWIKKWKGIW